MGHPMQSAADDLRPASQLLIAQACNRFKASSNPRSMHMSLASDNGIMGLHSQYSIYIL